MADQTTVDEMFPVIHLEDRAPEKRPHPFAVDARAEPLLVAEDGRGMLVGIDHHNVGAEVVHALHRRFAARDLVAAVRVSVVADVGGQKVGDIEVVLGGGHGSGHTTRD